MKTLNAFSLLEIVVVMGILVAVALIVLPLTVNQLQEARSEVVAADISSLLFAAQQDAYARKDGKSYGIFFETNQYTLFIGDSYGTAESTDVVTLPDNVTISNIGLASGDEIAYLSGNFRPEDNGTLNITEGTQTYQINIDPEGLIDFYPL
ncbi:MAG: Tfp pilus assembly protein FimT/FimU [Candidatus Dojkabacteria bacterium]